MFQTKKLYFLLLLSAYFSTNTIEIPVEDFIKELAKECYGQLDKGAIPLKIKGLDLDRLPSIYQVTGCGLILIGAYFLNKENQKEKKQNNNWKLPAACAVVGFSLMFSKQIGQLFTFD